MSQTMTKLANEVRSCSICENLPLGPKPIFQFSDTSKILIAGQAPGRITHNKGIPFDDPSGNRLREWLGIDRRVFYDASKIAIVPMGFCFPGTNKSGDLPPREECAKQWRERLLSQMQQIELTIVIGRYALDWHIPNTKGQTVTNIVKDWHAHWPQCLPMPHPSPRNNRWLKNNPWFETDLLPILRKRIRALV